MRGFPRTLIFPGGISLRAAILRTLLVVPCRRLHGRVRARPAAARGSATVHPARTPLVPPRPPRRGQLAAGSCLQITRIETLPVSQRAGVVALSLSFTIEPRRPHCGPCARAAGRSHGSRHPKRGDPPCSGNAHLSCGDGTRRRRRCGREEYNGCARARTHAASAVYKDLVSAPWQRMVYRLGL